MHSSGISGWRWARTTWLAVACVIGFTSSAVYGQKDMGYGYCTLHRINYQGSNCPSCSSGSSGNSAPYNGPNLWNMLRERKEKKARQLRQDAWNANEQGVEFSNKGDWAKAIVSYQRSLKLDPNDPIVLRNLAKAQQALAYNAQTELANEQSNQLAARQDKAAAANMQQAINSFAQSLNSAPTKAASSGLEFGTPAAGNTAGKGGLDFMPGNSTQTKQAVSPAKALLEFGDPMVVDLRNATPDLPKDLKDAVADTPKDKATGAPMSSDELDSLEGDLRKRLAESAAPQTQAWLEAQLAWTLQQKGNSKGAVEAIERASALDPDSPMLKLLRTSAFAETKEQFADAVWAAQEYLKSHPGNRVATAILAEADGKLRQAMDAAAPGRVAAPLASSATANQLPLVPFAQQRLKSPGDLSGTPETDKARAEKEFGFQNFGKQGYQPHWQEPPAMDKRINLEKYPELKQSQTKRAELVAQFKGADPVKAEEIKKQVASMDKETEKKAEEIIKKDFAAAPGL